MVLALIISQAGIVPFITIFLGIKNLVQMTLKTEGQYSLPNLRIPVYCSNLNKRKLLLEPQKIDGYNFDL